MTSPAFDESKHPRGADGTFANKTYADAGQLDLGATPLGNTERLYDLAGDRDPGGLSAEEIAHAATFVDPELEAEVNERLPNLSAQDRSQVASTMSRGRLLSAWFGEGGRFAAQEALDHDESFGTDLVGVDPDQARDEDGIDFDALAERSSYFWSYEAHNTWENAKRRNNGWV